VKSLAEALTDQELFETLYSETRMSILGYLLRRVSIPTDAADLLSDTYLVAWRRIGDVPEGESGLLWLYGVARHLVANYYRHERSEHALALTLRHALAANASAFEREHDAPFAEDIARSLEALSPGDREIIELSAWEQLTPAEIAEVLGIKAGTLRVRLHRARLAIAEELAKAGHPGPDRLEIAE
jgi:RNA polymerase sigma-70 factor (ECF subfamily)